MNFRKKLLASSCLCLIALSCPAAHANLLLDAGFEGSARDAWGLQVSSADSNATLARSSYSRSGQGSLLLQGNGTADVWQTLKVQDTQPNTQYVMSLWVKPSVNCSDDLTLKVGFEAKYGEVVDYAGLRVINAGSLRKGQWNRVQASYLTTGQLSQLSAKIMAFAKDENSNIMVAFDDAEVTTTAPNLAPQNVALDWNFTKSGQLTSLNARSEKAIIPLLESTGFSGFEVSDVTTGKTARIATSARRTDNGWVIEGVSQELQLKLNATLTSNNGRLTGHVDLIDLTKTDRAITARALFKLADKNWRWHGGFSDSVQTQVSGKYSTNGGFANHAQSAYPFAALSTPDGIGLALAWPMENPRFNRLRYEVDGKGVGQLAIESDLGMANETTKFPNSANFDFVLYGYDGQQQFRGALNGYYALYPNAFKTIVQQQGLWTLWVSEVAKEYAKRAGVAYHQAEYDLLPDASMLKMNQQQGMLSFEYTEPWGFWHPVPKGFLAGAAKGNGTIAKSWEENVATKPLADLVKTDLQSNVEADRYPGATRSEIAKAIENSAIWKDDKGEWLVSIAGSNFHWGNGDRRGSDFAVIIANPDPDLPHPNRADIAWEKQVGFVEQRAKAAGTGVGGFYVDSLVFSMGWDRYNFRREHWKYADAPLSFTTLPDGKIVPAQAMALTNAKFLRRTRDFAHARNWPILANSWHPLYPIIGAYIDIIGAGEYSDPKQVIDQSIFAQFRALAYRKPVSVMDYVLHFENLPVNQQSVDQVIEPRINRYLMYGIYPGTANGWHPEKLDRLKLVEPVFEKYVPLCRAINLAGWDPNTGATTDSREVTIERWGAQPATGLYFTLWNNGSSATQTEITISRKQLGSAEIKSVRELVSSQDCVVTQQGENIVVSVNIPPQRTVVLQCQ